MDTFSVIFYSIRVLESSVLFILLTIILQRYLKYRLNTILVFFFMVLGFFISGLALALYAAFEVFKIPLIGFIYMTSTAVSFSFLILFPATFSGKVSVTKIVTAVSVAAAMIGVILTELDSTDIRSYIVDNSTDLDILVWGNSVTAFLLPTFIIVAVWLIQDLNIALKLAVFEKQRTQIKLMRVGFFFAVYLNMVVGIIYTILSQTIINPEIGQWVLRIVQPVIIVIGLVIVIYAYAREDGALFYQPFALDGIIVINEMGLPIYQYTFDDQDKEEGYSLVSGAITAIGAIMKEAFGARSNIRSVQLEDKIMIIHFENDLAFVLVTERASLYLRESLQRFAKYFVNAFENELAQSSTVFSDDNGSLIKSTFGLSLQ